jgi:hypothetical protein
MSGPLPIDQARFGETARLEALLTRVSEAVEMDVSPLKTITLEAKGAKT